MMKRLVEIMLTVKLDTSYGLCFHFLFRIIFIAVLTSLCEASQTENAAINLHAGRLHIKVSRDARVISAVDESTGKDYLEGAASAPFAVMSIASNRLYANRITQHGAITRVFFDARHSSLDLLMTTSPDALSIRFLSCTDTGFIRIDLLNIHLAIERREDSDFGVCLFGVTSNADIVQSPVLQDHLRWSVYPFPSPDNSTVLVAGGKPNDLKKILGRYLSNGPAIERSPFGGPFADSSTYARGSYVCSYGTLNQSNVMQWSQFIHSIGFSQVQFIGGSESFFRFGDFQLNVQHWPQGWENMRAVLESLRKEGIQSTLHTYAFLLDSLSCYVSPIPHQDLAFSDSIILSSSVNVTDSLIAVQPFEMARPRISFEAGTIFWIGDELMEVLHTVRSSGQTLYYCRRGAFRTAILPHRKGSIVRIPHMAYGHFSPVPGSVLFRHVARLHAHIINACGFDGLYLDGIDAMDRISPDLAWYWVPEFVREIRKHLERPIGMDMGHNYHHLWRYRSRFETWDAPLRGYRTCISSHVSVNASGAMLPPHLGWWYWTTPKENANHVEESESEFTALVFAAKRSQAGLSFIPEPDLSNFAPSEFRRRTNILSRFWNGGNTNTSALAFRETVMVLTVGGLHHVKLSDGENIESIEILPTILDEGISLGSLLMSGKAFVKKSQNVNDNTSNRNILFPIELYGPLHSEEVVLSDPTVLSNLPAVSARWSRSAGNGIINIRYISNDAFEGYQDRFIRIQSSSGHGDAAEFSDAMAMAGEWDPKYREPWKFYRGSPAPDRIKSIIITYSSGKQGTKVLITDLTFHPIEQSRPPAELLTYDSSGNSRIWSFGGKKKIEFLQNSDYFTNQRKKNRWCCLSVPDSPTKDGRMFRAKVTMLSKPSANLINEH